MQSPRARGIFALSAVILAAISFAVVDVSIANAGDDATLPGPAIVFAVVGTLALLASVLPAISWFVDRLHHAHPDLDIDPARMVVARPVYEDDDL